MSRKYINVLKISALTLSQTTNLRLFQTERVCRRQSENGRKFSKWVKNTMGKGEIARMSNFSFSHSAFKRLLLQTRKNQGLFGKGLKNMYCY